MLLACRQRQNETAPPQGVRCFARNPPGHLPQIFFPRREEAYIGPAKIQAVADGLDFAGSNIRPHCSRRLDETERDSLGKNCNQKRARRLADRGGFRKAAKVAEEIRVLYNRTSGIAINMR